MEKRLYPSSSFGKTFIGRQKEFVRDMSALKSPGEIYLHLLDSPLFNNLTIECGEVDGAVLGPWTNVNDSSSDPMINEDNAHIGYWAAAAVWSNVWDQRTIDRVSHYLCVLPLKQLHYVVESQWKENVVVVRMDLVPNTVLKNGLGGF